MSAFSFAVSGRCCCTLCESLLTWVRAFQPDPSPVPANVPPISPPFCFSNQMPCLDVVPVLRQELSRRNEQHLFAHRCGQDQIRLPVFQKSNDIKINAVFLQSMRLSVRAGDTDN